MPTSNDESPDRNAAPSAGPLLPERAFVVHLRSSDAGGDVFVGRIEHIVTGEVRRFASGAELLASIAEIEGVRCPTTAGRKVP